MKKKMYSNHKKNRPKISIKKCLILMKNNKFMGLINLREKVLNHHKKNRLKLSKCKSNKILNKKRKIF